MRSAAPRRWLISVAPLRARQQQQRVVPHLVGDLRLDQLVVEVGERLLGAAGLEAAAEADAALGQLLRREDPVEPVERAFVERRVVLHRALHARDERRLGAAVRAVQQDEAVGPPLAREVRDQAVDRRLDLLLPHQRVLAAVEGAVEQAPARHHAARRPHRLGAEVVEHVAHVLARRTQLPRRLRGEQRQVLGERDDPPVAREVVAHLAGGIRQPTLGVEDPGTIGRRGAFRRWAAKIAFTLAHRGSTVARASKRGHAA